MDCYGKKRVGLIRVLTTNDEVLLKSHENILKERFNDFQIETKCIEDHPKGIYDDNTMETAVPKIVELGHEFQNKGYNTIYISCAGDPGLEECRRALEVPVIGAGSSSASLALGFGSRIGVMGITQEVPDAIYKRLKDYLVSYIKPDGINTTLDLYSDRGMERVVDAAEKLKERNCDVIILACTGLATIGAYRKIVQSTNIVTIDPVIASGTIISYL